MKVGDYVRTKSNGIQKIDEEGRINLGFIRPPFKIIKKEELLKSSPNIIDLIEVGDYVNGWRVMLKNDDYFFVGDENEGTWHLLLEDIKSIVTKEQFESIEYKVKE